MRVEALVNLARMGCWRGVNLEVGQSWVGGLEGRIQSLNERDVESRPLEFQG